MTQKERDRLEELLIDATRKLDPTEAIDVSDERYVDCMAVRGEEGLQVTKIDETILRACKAGSNPKTYLFSGYNGSGKSTELKTLANALDREKLFTITINAVEAIDLEDPNYIDILFSMATEIEKHMKKNGWKLSKKLMKDISNWFNEVTLVQEVDKSISTGVGGTAEAGAKIPLIGALLAKFQVQLKYSSNERKTIRKKLEPAVSQLMGFINKMVMEAEKKIKQKGYLGLVIIYDNLEKMKLAYYGGNKNSEGRSTHEIIFLDNAHHLSGILCHKIYTVPLSLLYSMHRTRLEQLYDEQFVLPMIKVCRTRSRDHSQEGIDIFSRIAEKRLDVGQIFKDKALIKDIALFSGGNVRDFIRLLKSMVEAVKPEELPLTEKNVQFTFRRKIRNYEIAPSEEEFELLAHVYNTFSISNDSAHYRMLNNHLILAYINGGTWYDVHPALQKVLKFEQALQKLNHPEKKS